MADGTATEPTANPLGNTHEARLLEDLKQLDEGMRDKGVIRLHMSRLQPENRSVQNLRSAEIAFDELTNTRSAWLYRLRNSDLIVIFDRYQTEMAEKAVSKLLKVLERDPLMQKFKSDPRKNRLTTWFDLEADYDKLLQFAHRQAASGDSRPAKTLQQLIIEREHRMSDPERGQTLTPLELSKVEEALQRVDLSSFTRRQAVCAFVEDDKAELVFTELFVSIADLRETLMPRTDMTANPWLFQRLTQSLDRRVMAQIARRDDRTLMNEGMSINLNIQTLLSEEFMAFDEDFAPTTNDVILEMRLEDIFADPDSYTFARDFVTERGYRLCVDGLTLQTFKYADPERLGVHYLKLGWTRDLAGWVGTELGQNLKNMIRARKKGRTILSRCDSEACIQVGRQLGISLFQGRYVDSVLRKR